MKIRSACSAAASLVLAASAFAQPASTDLGPVTIGTPILTTNSIGAAAEIDWYQFTLTDTISLAASRWMDIDTVGTAFADSEIGLYRADGTLVSTDDDDASGNLSALSFGTGSELAAGVGGAVSNGRDGALVPGTYYLAIGAFNATFGTTAFGVTSTATATGNYNININTGNYTPPTPPANTDLGSLGLVADVLVDNAPISASSVVWFKFTLANDVSNALGRYLDIDTEGSVLTAANDTRIGLYNSIGRLVTADSDDGSGTLSQLTYGLTTPARPAVGTSLTYTGRDGALAAGVYYIAVAPGNAGTNGALGFGFTSTGANSGTFDLHLVTNAVTTNPTATLSEAPDPTYAGQTVLFRATVTSGSNPASTGITVTADLSQVGGSATQQYFDNGTNGDVTPGDNIYSYAQVIAGAPAAYTLPVVVADAEGRFTNLSHAFTIVPPPPANDECVGAFPAITGNNPYDTNGALTSLPASTCGLIGTDVWFVWNSGPGGQTTIETCGLTAAVDTAIAVYSDCTTSVACDDDSCPTSAESVLTFCAAPSTNYLIRIGDFAGGSPHIGSFNITQIPGSGSPTIGAAASPTCGTEGTAVTITANLTNAGCPAQTVTGVSADASVIGGGTVTLLDDGVAPDVTAADGTYTGATTFGVGATSGNINVTANLSGGGTAAATIAMTVPGMGSDEAGDALATAAVLTGGSITSISGSLNSTPGTCTAGADDVDMYKFQICDPANFSASTVGGTTMDTQLFLFNNNGFGVVVDDDCPAGTLQSCLSSAFTSTLSVGNFYLAISAYNQDPLDSGGALIWANTPFNVERAPDGPGAANALASWDLGGGGTGAYTITLTGVCGAAPDCHGECVADFDDGSGLGIPDGGVTIDDLLYYLGIFEAGVICADVDDGSFTGTQDMGVTIDDLLYYLFRFEEGC